MERCIQPRRARPNPVSLLLLIGGLLAACAPQPPEPELYAVIPAWADNDSAHTVTILGGNLYPRLQVTGDEALEIDRQFRAWLVPAGAEVEAGAVQAGIEITVTDLRGYAELTGHVPAGLAPGLYDLRLEAPTGLSDALAGAFLITDSAADSFELQPDRAGYSVSEEAVVQVRVETRDGEVLGEDFPVRIRAEGPGPLFFHPTLEGQRSLPEGIVEGVLPGGAGLLRFETTVPGTYTLRVEPGEGGQHPPEEALALTFSAGSVADVELAVAAGASVEAGEMVAGVLRLLDAAGNPTLHPSPLWFSIEEDCLNGEGSFSADVVVPANTSEVPVELWLQVVGGVDCDEGTWKVEALSEGLDLSAKAGGLEVRPGPPQALELNTFGDDVFVAGEESVTLVIEVYDGYGNRLEDYQEPLAFDDGVGGVSSAECQDWSSGEVVCDLTLIRAAEGIRIQVESADGLLYEVSDTISVLAGPPARVGLDAGSGVSVAGEGREARLTVTDAYENPVVIATLGEEAPRFRVVSDPLPASEGTEVGCLLRADRPGEQEYRCELTAATEAVSLRVDVAGLRALSAPFSVVNGPLAEVRLEGVSDEVAGAAQGVVVTGLDAWGNPFIEVGGGSRDIELYDDSGDVSELVVALDARGQARRELTLTTAWDDNQLHAYQGGVWLGSSASFDVRSGDLVGYRVEPEQTWARLAEPLPVRVEAVDTWGNAVVDHAGTAVLTSLAGLGEAVALSGFIEGAIEAEFVFDTRGVGDTLRVRSTASGSGGSSGTTYEGSSSAVDAVWTECSAGPSAALLVDGRGAAVLCRQEGTTGAVSLSGSGSTRGGTALATWHFYTEAGGWQRQQSSNTTASWEVVGQQAVQLVVVDGAGCADPTSAVVYVADDDGEAAGPVAVSLRDSTLEAASTTGGQVVVDIAATDCLGAAAGGMLRVRATAGEVLSNSTTTVASSGSGLEFDLDSRGQAQLLWDVGGQEYGGMSAALYVGRVDGAAAGSTTASVVGDARRPVLLSMSPAGTSADPAQSLSLRFSEPIDAATVGDSTITVLDPDGMALDVLDYAVDEAQVTLTLRSRIQPAAGTYALVLDRGITDVDGNGLSGDHSGSSADFTVDFGAVPDTAPDISGCLSSPGTFRPDGDDGSGKETDDVAVSFTATGDASWWRVEILDAAGEGVGEWLEPATGTSASGSLSWDGRDAAGQVVADGTYLLLVSGLDDSWNEGSACTAAVVVDNPLP